MKKNSLFDPIYHRLSTLAADQKSKVVAVACAGRGEGVTTVVGGLARSAVKSGVEPVLVIDAAPRGRRIASLLRVKTKALTSLPECLNSEQDNLESYIARSSRSNVDVLTIDAAQLATIDSSLWQQTLDRLRSKYSLIVVDTGNLNSPIPIFWQHCADEIVLVIDTTRTTIESLRRVRKDLDGLKLQVTGFVLNKRRFYVPKFLYRSIY